MSTGIKSIPIFDLIEEPKHPGGYLAIDLSYGHKAINQNLLKFLQYDVLPDYLRILDRSRSVEHILDVCEKSYILSEYVSDGIPDYDIVVTAAVYHDIGLTFSFKNLINNDHYCSSYESLEEDKDILMELGLTEKQIEIIETAILEMPLDEKSNLYSAVLADADKISELKPDYLIKKVSNYIVAMYTYKPVDALVNGIYNYIHRKYGSKQSPGRKFYTSVGKDICNRKIKNIERIANDKYIFLSEFKKIIREENIKKRYRKR